MTASLVLVGDELVEGHRADGHVAWLAGQITALGGRVLGARMVGDDPERIGSAIRAAADEGELVIVCGGIGPTDDDRTRDGLALATGRPLVEVEAAVEAIRATLRARGIEPQPGHPRQGTVTEGGRWLDNPEGVAPGIEAELLEARVFVLPGVPKEMHAMFALHVEPRLLERGGGTVAETGLWAAGLTEPQVEERLKERLADHPVRVGYYPHDGEIEVRLLARGPDAGDVVARAREAAEAGLGEHAYAPFDGPIEHAVIGALRAQRRTVGTAESLTGGLVAEMLTRVPGASEAELVAIGIVPMKIMTMDEQNRPSAMNTRALLRSETLPMMNFDRP